MDMSLTKNAPQCGAFLLIPSSVMITYIITAVYHYRSAINYRLSIISPTRIGRSYHYPSISGTLINHFVIYRLMYNYYPTGWRRCTDAYANANLSFCGLETKC
jgi:hypothetical protein